MQTEPVTDSRDRILSRIREALQTTAPKRHLHAPAGTATHGLGEDPAQHGKVQDWLPPVPATQRERIALFEKNSADLKTRVIRCADESEVTAALVTLAADESWRRVAAHRFPAGQVAIDATGLTVTWVDAGYDVEALESADAGITGCECLVSQTGSILVTAKSSGGRALSVLPPHHVVIAHCSQVAGDLSDALAIAKNNHAGATPAFLSFITGPSRTGDIERILVLGAHGPKQLTVIIVGIPAN